MFARTERALGAKHGRFLAKSLWVQCALWLAIPWLLSSPAPVDVAASVEHGRLTKQPWRPRSNTPFFILFALFWGRYANAASVRELQKSQGVCETSGVEG
mgnify:CR=1